MRQYWRLQQSQTLISMAFWVTTLTLLIWPYVSWRFEGDNTIIGISTTYWGLASIGTLVITFVLFVGFVYDRFLGLWKEQRTVDTERNPFATYQLMPQTAMIMGHLNELLRRQAMDDEAVQASCNWVDEWLDWCCNQEIWDRSQKVWDSNFTTPVPPLSFLPQGVVESARGRIAERKDDSD